jgi:hypothetical protein
MITGPANLASELAALAGKYTGPRVTITSLTPILRSA